MMSSFSHDMICMRDAKHSLCKTARPQHFSLPFACGLSQSRELEDGGKHLEYKGGMRVGPGRYAELILRSSPVVQHARGLTLCTSCSYSLRRPKTSSANATKESTRLDLTGRSGFWISLCTAFSCPAVAEGCLDPPVDLRDSSHSISSFRT